MTFLVDAHHLGHRQTGNETWTRNMVRELATLLPREALEIAVTPQGRGALRELVGEEGHLIHWSGPRRLGYDLPRLARRVDASALLVQYTTALSRTPAVLAVHDLSFEDPRADQWLGPVFRHRLRLTVRASCRRAARVITLSEHGRRTIIDRYGLDPDRVEVAGCAVDPGLALALAEAEPIADESFRVLVVGNVVARKNIVVVARAVRALRDAGLDAVLRVVGSASASATTLVAEIEQLLETHVTFSGYVDQGQLAQEYVSADVVCYPSLYEGFGIPVLEAMAARVPVVASTSTSLPEVVGEAGLLADPHCHEAWVAAISSLHDDDDLRGRLVQRGVERAAAFSWRASAEVVVGALRRCAQ